VRLESVICEPGRLIGGGAHARITVDSGG
jgi:hypothetical protein